MSLISMRLTLTPRRDRSIDYAKQALIDLVAMRQDLVEIHRAHHRADVGHGQDSDRVFQIGDLVARLRRLEHLKKGDAVHRHRCVVLGNHLLLGNGDHLLHHVHLATDAVEIRDDEVQPRRQRAGVLAETFDGPVIALRYRLDAGKQRDDDEQHKNDGENIETGKHNSSQTGTTRPRAPSKQISFKLKPCRLGLAISSVGSSAVLVPMYEFARRESAISRANQIACQLAENWRVNQFKSSPAVRAAPIGE